MRTARRFTIEGRVQGVFFRESTRRVAESLNITGHAINLSNGSVEVLAFGEPAAIEQLAVWLKDGPRMATVDSVAAEDVDATPPDRFTTG
jgi:acylphosphatase